MKAALNRAMILGSTLLAVAIVVPNLLPTRENPNMHSCINNLRLIALAKEQFALENNKTNSSVLTWADIQLYMGRGRGYIPKCPLGGTYTLGPMNTKPTCSYTGHVLQ